MQVVLPGVDNAKKAKSRRRGEWEAHRLVEGKTD
jgi:hypothetical protein